MCTLTKTGEYVNRRGYYRKRNNDRRIVRKPLLQSSSYLNINRSGFSDRYWLGGAHGLERLRADNQSISLEDCLSMKD